MINDCKIPQKPRLSTQKPLDSFWTVLDIKPESEAIDFIERNGGSAWESNPTLTPQSPVKPVFLKTVLRVLDIFRTYGYLRRG